MNRAELQQLSYDRIDDAAILLGNARWTAAYYLLGYAVETGLKACILKFSMDTATLVNEQVKDGQLFIDHLRNAGFPVDVAFWVCTSEEGLWFLYIASPAVDTDGLAAAFQRVYAELPSSRAHSVARSDIKLIGSTNPIARDARRHQTSTGISRFDGRMLGSMIVEEARIYPKS